MSEEKLKRSKSCGILLFSRKMKRFLLMRHPTRLDIPKGHTEKGESEHETALREFEEETGISPDKIEFIEDFRFELKYRTYEKRYKQVCDKTLVIFGARLKTKRKQTPIIVTEHEGFEWFRFSPPHDIQEKTINPLLAYAARFFQEKNILAE